MKKEDKKVNLVATYGSLRANEYNLKRFQQYYPGQIKVIAGAKVKGYDLYDLGSYPGIKQSENPEKELIVDILEMSDEAFNSVNSMELGAGYSAQKINIDGQDCTIFQYEGHSNRLVESGDWSSYLLNGKK